MLLFDVEVCGLFPFAKAIRFIWSEMLDLKKMEQIEEEDKCWIAKLNALDREHVLDCMIWIYEITSY